MADAPLTIWAAVPVKAFGEAKSRLSAALPASVRERLAETMLMDVLGAIGQCRRVHQTVVVTADPGVRALAEAMGAQVLHDRFCRGQTSAVEQAVEELQRQGCTAMLTLPGDLPLLKAQELDAICDLLTTSTPLVIAPAGNDGGTNALVCALPTSMTFHFGEDSFAKHVRAATTLKLNYALADIAGFRLDLDRPKDLEDFMAHPSDTKTYSFLRTVRPQGLSGGSLG